MSSVYKRVYNNLELKALEMKIDEKIEIEFEYNKYEHINKNEYKREIMELLEKFLEKRVNYELVRIITDRGREYKLKNLHLLFCTNSFNKVKIEIRRRFKQI